MARFEESRAPQPSVLDIKIEFTWRKILLIAAGTALEIGVLALIFDSSLGLKIATVIVAALALAAIYFETWLEARRKYFFAITIGILGAIYLCFVGYAIAHAVALQRAETKLRSIYNEGNELIERRLPIDPKSPQNSQFFDADADSQLEHDALEWQSATAKWLAENIGPAARVRFLDKSTTVFLCWGPPNACDQRAATVKSRLAADERNLSVILEQMAVYSQ